MTERSARSRSPARVPVSDRLKADRREIDMRREPPKVGASDQLAPALRPGRHRPRLRRLPRSRLHPVNVFTAACVSNAMARRVSHATPVSGSPAQERWRTHGLPQSGPVDRPRERCSFSLSPRRDGSDRRGREHLGVVAGEDDGAVPAGRLWSPVRRLQRCAGHTTLPVPRCDGPRSWISADEPSCR